MARSLVISSCVSVCEWRKTDTNFETEPLFACAGCGSEWVPSEAWTPVDADGHVPEAVQAAVQLARRRGRG